MDVKLFQTGQYQSLLENLNLEKVKLDGSGCGSIAEQLSFINNLTVCRYLLGKDDQEKKNCCLEFVDVLKKCRSVPARGEILCVELGSLYNYMYHVIKRVCKGDRTTEEADMYNQAYRTLSRVCKVLSQQTRLGDVLQYTEIKLATDAMLNDILEKLKFGIGNESLARSVCQCALFLGFLKIRDEEHSTAYKLLEKLHSLLRNIEIDVSRQLSLCLPLTIEHSDIHVMDKVQIENVVSLLKGVCLCQDHAFDKAFNIFGEIRTQQIRSIAQFFSGYTLFKRGKYTECISSVLEMLRSGQPLTQRLKARIYNLAGKCFDKLNKCQLSVQMFKEALCADFSYLVPLYNTSLQYRNQGVEDMELECLNLLTTALAMREKTENYDSMDLVCLLNTEDEDIPYIQALYSLSLRSLQLKRYDVAAEKYVCLLDHLKSWKVNSKELKNCIPPLLQVHHEAIEALLMSRKYKECVSLCDRVILCYHGNVSLNDTSMLSQTFDLTQSQGGDGDSQTENRKRKYDDLSQSQDEEHFGDVDVIALSFKAKALVKMGDNSSSLLCLERALDSITSYRKYRMRQKMKSASQSAVPSRKRQKTDKTSSATQQNDCMESEEELPSTSNNMGTFVQVGDTAENICDKTSVIRELFKDSGRMLELEQDLYEMTAQVLAAMEKDDFSICHFKRLASQIQVLKEKL